MGRTAVLHNVLFKLCFAMCGLVHWLLVSTSVVQSELNYFILILHVSYSPVISHAVFLLFCLHLKIRMLMVIIYFLSY